MKKLTTTIINKNGEEQVISAIVDDQTAEILENQVDEKTRNEYIVEEYKIQKKDRNESDHTQSLELSMERGHDFADPSMDVEKIVFAKIERESLKKAVMELTPEQQWLIKQVYFLKRKKVDVAADLGIDDTSVRDRLRVIYKKIKNIL